MLNFSGFYILGLFSAFHLMFSYGQRGRCADMLNSYYFRLIVQRVCMLTALTVLSILCS